MQPDAVTQPFLDLGAVWTGELKALQRVRDRRFFLARTDVDAREILRALRRLHLREVDDIDRTLSLRDEALERLRERRLGVGILERHGPFARRHCDGRTPVQA